jgi:hypothetical protein
MLVLTLLLFCVFYVHAADSGAWIDYPADGTATMTHYTIPDGSGLVLMLETILIHTESRIYRRMWMRRRQYCMYRSFYFSSLPLLHFSLSIRIIQHMPRRNTPRPLFRRWLLARVSVASLLLQCKS